MKITNFNKVKTSATLNESLKKKFGYTLNINKMSLPLAKKTVVTMKESLNAFRDKVGEKATNSKVYMEKLLVIETLAQFIKEKEQAIGLERREAKLKVRLHEAEQAEAEVVLAAKDMVDTLQGMIEDLGSMQNEQLQPLVDSIRQTLGDESSSSFEAAMSASISSALDAVRAARIDADHSARMLSGEEGASDDFMGGEEGDLGLGMDAEPDMGVEPDMGMDAPVDAGLGRETRDVDLAGI